MTLFLSKGPDVTSMTVLVSIYMDKQTIPTLHWSECLITRTCCRNCT